MQGIGREKEEVETRLTRQVRSRRAPGGEIVTTTQQAMSGMLLLITIALASRARARRLRRCAGGPMRTSTRAAHGAFPVEGQSPRFCLINSQVWSGIRTRYSQIISLLLYPMSYPMAARTGLEPATCDFRRCSSAELTRPT
jgi:hypothetical protein